MVDALRQLLIPYAMAAASSLLPADEGICTFDHFFGSSGPPVPGEGFQCVALYVTNLTFVVIGFTASIALIMLMLNGYRYMIGPAIPGGSSDAAKKGITMALVGLAVSLLTYVILDTLIYSVTQS